MKDSKNKLKKSSSESKILETKTVPPMPKDKRTKEYKEWYKKYGGIDKKDKKPKSKKNKSIKQKKENLDIPTMPKDKRTKEYKEWYKKYGEIDKKEKRSTSKKNQTKKEGSKIDKSLKLKDLVILFSTKVDSDDWLSDRKFIEEIKKKIELALKDEFDKEKKKFGKNKKGDEKFIYRSDSKILFQKSLKTFSSKKRKYYSEIGTIQKQNLEKRLELIEKIKDLLNAEKQPNNLYQTFKKFKEEWHNIGQVPITERNNIWETYRHNVKKFYDFLHLNRELKELDFKHNYDEKLKIINKAEALDKVENTMQASRDLNALHKLWKNELGPVSKEFREELWTRFQKASNKIHSKRQKLQKEISSIQNENSLEKEKVLLKMKESSENVPNSHNEWQNRIQLFNKLKDDFQKIRNIPKKKNKVFWNNFRIITKEFNNKKNSFYKNQKIELKKNVDIKKNLIEEVNKILKQENYTQNSKRVIEIQNEWKKVGYIPKKISSSLWNEFRPLCNEFFNNLKSKSKTSNKERTAIKKDKEKQSLKRKISELQNESNQFENNLEYFTNSSSDNPLFKDVSSKITSINDEIEVLKKKLRKITKTEKAEVAKLATTEAEASNETETLNDGES
tara:strand:+ start:701 stop:2554 length:1854 start_codon:yes stop_codon:yes gene_type:complete